MKRETVREEGERSRKREGKKEREKSMQKYGERERERERERDVIWKMVREGEKREGKRVDQVLGVVSATEQDALAFVFHFSFFGFFKRRKRRRRRRSRRRNKRLGSAHGLVS
jgi:hypothetical protein